MSNIDDMLARIDAELAANQADRDAHFDLSIADLVYLGHLPESALDWAYKKVS